MMGIDNHWLWLIAATILAIAELVVPGVYLIWIGGAALITGLAALFLPLPVVGQFGLFALTAFIAVYAGRRYVTNNPIKSDDPLLNDRGARLVGSIVTAVEPVDNTHGRVKVGDGVWSARGADAAVGDRLRVTGSDGNVLLVERV
jgi:inner membrane protein